MNAFSEDTIAAISTPVAAGGIGMVRISGPQALEVADRVFRSVSGKQVQQTEGYRGLYGRVHDGQDEIDEAVVFVYRAPKSYTGENVAEICCHGGVYLVQRTLRACIAAGARPAQAGEFTRRAFLNGKMSLTQAEAVMDLIASQGQQSAQAALQAKDGAVFSKIHQVIDRMLSISSALAAWVDYPDEDIDEVSDDNLRAGVEEICRRLGIKTLIATEINRKTGKVVDPYCYRGGKLERFRMVFGEDAELDEYYTDTPKDSTMLEHAKVGYLVKKGKITRIR